MPLQSITREFLDLVEKETGYPAKLLEDPSLETLCTVRMAGGTVPAHFIRYKPTRDESLDYLICYQCGFVLRLFESPPEQRFSFGSTVQGEKEVIRLAAGPDSKLATLGLPKDQVEHLAGTMLDGLMAHLRSIPIGMRIAAWILAKYPQLHASQRAAVLSELDGAKLALQPPIREMTPDRLYRPAMAINAAYAQFWADQYGTSELAAPYRFSEHESDGQALLRIWREVPADPSHDRQLVDRWAEKLQLTGWYAWVRYVAP